MKSRLLPLHASLAVLIGAGLISGCNWVDSTGRQSNSTPTIILDDGTPEDGFTLTLNEQATAEVDPSASSDDDGNIVSWSWDSRETDAGALEACAQVDGFNSALAADSLEDACTSSNACEVLVSTEEVEKDETELAEDQAAADAAGITSEIATTKTVFTLTAPQLKAPVGLTYRIRAKDNDGGTGTADVTLCLIAINEAPEAQGDTFTVISGTQRVVLGSTAPNLLSNDSDDIDVSNQPLTVVTTPVVNPTRATEFTLGNDGGFTYYYAGSASDVGDLGSDTFTYEITDGIFTDQAEVTINLVAEDDPPVLTGAIPDQTAYAGIPFRFDFSDFFRDPEGAQLTFGESTGNVPDSFDATALQQGRLSGTPTSAEAANSPYSLSLFAYDGLNTVEDSVTLTIAGNQAPTLSAIPDQTGTLGRAFSLNLASYAKDPEGQTLTYAVANKPSFLSLSGSTLSGTPNTDGSWDVAVSVSDGFNPAVSRTFEFSVVNAAPTLSEIPAQTGSIGNRFSLNLASFADDPEGQTLTYSMSGAPAFLSLSGSTLSGTPTTDGSWNISVTVADPLNAKATRSFTFSVVNSAPTLEPIPTQRGTVNTGFSLNLADYASDPEGQTLSYSMSGAPSFLSLSGSTISGTPTTDGEWTINVSVNDGQKSTSGSFNLTVTNPPPTSEDIPNQTATVGTSFTLNAGNYFSDPNGDTLSFTVTALPAGLSMSERGVIGGSPLLSAVGTTTVTVSASDGNGSASESFTLTVVSGNSAPTVTTAAPDMTVTQGDTVSFRTVFADADLSSGDTLSFTAFVGRSGLTASTNATSVTVSGTANNVGTFNLSTTATDSEGETVTDSFTLTVEAGNSAPILAEPAEDSEVTVGDNVRITSEFTDPDGDSLACTIRDDGSGLSVRGTASGCVASARVDTAGIFDISVTATDPSGASATDAYRLTVNDAPVLNTPPTRVQKVISPTVALNDTVGPLISQFQDPDAADSTLTITIEKDGADFLNLTALAQEARVSGTADKTGTYNIVIRATDSAGESAVDEYSVTVTD